MSQSLWNRAVSYDKISSSELFNVVSLNPFGTGQCLTTYMAPLEKALKARSQSLWNRAVSYDKDQIVGWLMLGMSQSLWNRAVSYDCSGVIKPCATRLTEATSQLFPRLRELGLGLVKC